MKCSIKILSFIFIFTMSCFAQLLQDITIPHPFKTKEGLAVFIDILEAHHYLVFDFENKKVTYRTYIRFQNQINGHPIFDVVTNPKNVILDKQSVGTRPIVTPNQETTLRLITKTILPGEHELTMEGEIHKFVEFSNNGTVTSSFWFNDHRDRSFLEAYLPANLEYDQYPTTLSVELKGEQQKHRIFTNGNLIQSESEVSKIQFPHYFNASSIYFNLVPESSVVTYNMSYKNDRSEREIPITIYSLQPLKNIKYAMNKTMGILKELEKDFGPFPQDKLLIYLVATGMGGVEYVGAVVSEVKNLRHELLHQYLSKGYMPANGNAGWIDEAFTTWYDKNKPITSDLKSNYNLANQFPYTRTTDSQCYDHGVKFIGYLDNYLKQNEKPGIVSFVKYISHKNSRTIYTTEMFIRDMEAFYKLPLNDIFKKFVY